MRGKTKKVLEYLQTNGSITSLDAIYLFKATRLSSIIFNLKKYGYDIISVNEVSVDSDGIKNHYVRYFYKGEIKNER